MKSLISFKVFLIVFLSSKYVTSQTPDNPWSIGIGANTVQVLDESVESKYGFGPSVSIGRYLGAGCACRHLQMPRLCRCPCLPVLPLGVKAFQRHW